MRPVMTMTMHIGYTEGSLCRELSLKRCNITEDRGGLSVRDSSSLLRAAEHWTRETSHDKVMARVL
jgi:hypothetical protein